MASTSQDRTDNERNGGGGSGRTVLVAVAANAAIAFAKGIAGLLTGSAAMWAETLHSLADTGNEVLLYVGLRRSTKRPDRRHPFGYGQERFFWAFLAALGIFLIGGLLSIGEGVRSLLVPEPLESPWIGITVLLLAAAFEGYSWNTARKQLRADSRRLHRSMWDQLRRASDPSATTVYLEDTAALIGIGLALCAFVLHLLTGWAVWDAIASMLIGLLLMVVAYLLTRRSKALLLNESAPPDVLDRLREQFENHPWVAEVRRLEAVFVGPGELLVTADIVPVEDAMAAPAGELLRQAERVRAELLRIPALAETALTLVTPDGRPRPATAQDRSGDRSASGARPEPR